MSLLKKYQLTDVYWLEVCEKHDKDALNGERFMAEKEWVIEEVLSEDQSTVYTTMAAKRFNLTLKGSSPNYAIQQIVSYAYTGQQTKLINMWFKITKTQML